MMPEEAVLTTASEAQLAAAVQENHFAFFRAMATSLPGAELRESETLCMHRSFPSNSFFNGIWRTRLSAESVDATIDQTLAWFRTRNATSASWWTGPGTLPVNLAARLQAHGLTPLYAGEPGMAADLQVLEGDIHREEGLTVVPALDRKALEACRDVFAAAFEVPLHYAEAWVEAGVAAGLAHAPWQWYLGYWNGKPVATSLLFNGAGVAGIYGVGTLPEVRGRGMGSAITLAAMISARAMGYRFAVLSAAEMGYPVYLRLGFRDVACRLARYLWINR